MIYYVDIDGTICKTPVTDGIYHYEVSTPYHDRIRKINALYAEGHTIIYWTARGSNSGKDWSALTRQQLYDWGCLYHDVKFGKPAYDIWIDDKAIHSEDYFNGE